MCQSFVIFADLIMRIDDKYHFSRFRDRKDRSLRFQLWNLAPSTPRAMVYFEYIPRFPKRRYEKEETRNGTSSRIFTKKWHGFLSRVTDDRGYRWFSVSEHNLVTKSFLKRSVRGNTIFISRISLQKKLFKHNSHFIKEINLAW